MHNLTRRGFIVRMGGAVGVLSLRGAGKLYSKEQNEKREVEVSPAEDLMREHGVLRRVLLIYREWTRRLGAQRYADLDTLTESNRIIRSFVEDYHEKLEEEYLFPRFKKAGKLVDLVDVLYRQHQAGRKVTDTSLRLSTPESLKIAVNRKRLSRLLTEFIHMYQPHAAREDTVLFPAFHEFVPAKEYDELGDVFEKKENELFGERGFEKMVERVGSIEQKLGIYDLSRFTPHP